MPNYDEKTGIHYGVISPHSISGFALDDLYTKGTDPYYESGKKEITDKIRAVLDEYGFSIGQIDEVLDPVIDIYNETYQSDGSGIMDYSDKDYDLHISGDNFGIFVMRSPYYTFCRQCSPCAPNAGDLDNPVYLTEKEREDNVKDYGKTYCLPDDFFEDNKAPYEYYRVDNDQIAGGDPS
jgi:hypothetical protein